MDLHIWQTEIHMTYYLQSLTLISGFDNSNVQSSKKKY